MEKRVRRFFLSVFVQDLFAIPFARFFIRNRVSPNLVTLIGLGCAIASGILYILKIYEVGSILFFCALIFDSTDGRVARGLDRFSELGAKLDSIADKVRSFFVAGCFILSLELVPYASLGLFLLYLILPIVRILMSRRSHGDLYDPTILFWDGTRLSGWFVQKKILGLYTGWERAAVALIVAPLMNEKVAVFVIAILLEQLIFFLGLMFFKDSKIGLKV